MAIKFKVIEGNMKQVKAFEKAVNEFIANKRLMSFGNATSTDGHMVANIWYEVIESVEKKEKAT